MTAWTTNSARRQAKTHGSGPVAPTRALSEPGPPENATKRCDFNWVGPGLAEGDRACLERVQAQRLHKAGAAGAGAQRRHRGERVADDDEQAQLGAIAPLGSQGRDNDAGHPRCVRARPPPVAEAQQRVPGTSGPISAPAASSSREGVASCAMLTYVRPAYTATSRRLSSISASVPVPCLVPLDALYSHELTAISTTGARSGSGAPPKQQCSWR